MIRIFSGFLLSICSASSLADTEIIMGKGEQRIFRIAPLQKFAVGGNQIRAHFEPRTGLLVKALSPGLTDLLLIYKDGHTERRTFRVEPMEGTSLPASLLKALSRLEETSIYLTSKGAILKGTPQDFAELQRISVLLRGFEGQVWDETQPPETFLAEIQLRLQKEISVSQLPCSLEIQRYLSQLILTGECTHPHAREGVQKKLRAIYPLLHSEIEMLTTQVPTVHFKVYLLQVRKTAMSSLGVQWPGQIQNAVSVPGFQSRLGVDLSVNALEGQGKLHVLSRPELVVRAPGEAELFAGGELPIRLKTAHQHQVHWRPFGVRLKLKVEQSAGSRVRLDIATEVSDLDPQIAQEQIPGVQTNKMNTQVDAQYGRPLFLSGLVKESLRSGQEGLPVLSRIPLLGALFGTQTVQEEQTELVAVLVPGKLPPTLSLEKFKPLFPDGPMPTPRNHLTPEEEQAARNDPQFPWNVL